MSERMVWSVWPYSYGQREMESEGGWEGVKNSVW